MDFLDQYTIVDCNSVVEKHNFHWNGYVVSYRLFCLNGRNFLKLGFFINLIDVVCELSCSQ